MGYLIVAAIAKLLGRDPQELWNSTVKWVIKFCLCFVGFVIMYAAAGWVVETASNRLDPQPPTTTTTLSGPYIEDGLVHVPNRPSATAP